MAVRASGNSSLEKRSASISTPLSLGSAVGSTDEKLHQREQCVAQIFLGTHQFVQRSRAVEHFGHDGIDGAQQKGAGFFFVRGFADQRQQTGEFVVPTLGIGEMQRDSTVQYVMRVCGIGERGCQRAEFSRCGLGEVILPRITIDAMDGAGCKLVEAFDDLLHGCRGRRRLRHRDFLDRMLVERAGGFELFQRVGAMDKFGYGDLLACQEISEQARDG